MVYDKHDIKNSMKWRRENRKREEEVVETNESYRDNIENSMKWQRENQPPGKRGTGRPGRGPGSPLQGQTVPGLRLREPGWPGSEDSAQQDTVGHELFRGASAVDGLPVGKRPVPQPADRGRRARTVIEKRPCGVDSC